MPAHRNSRRVGLLAVLRSLRAELREVLGVWHRTTGGMWVVIGIMLLAAATVGLLPFGWASVGLQLLGMVFLSLVVAWPELFAHTLRMDDDAGIRDRDSPTVVTYLPVVLTLFTLPFYLLGQATLFFKLNTLNPTVLGLTGWADALRMSLDNLLLTELFLDLFDVFGLGLSQAPPSLVGRLILFTTRLVLSIGFVRMAVAPFRAAYHRAHGLGRGGDILTELQNSVLQRDAVHTGILGRELVAEVHGTVDVLLARLREPSEAGSRQSDTYRGLRALRDWAIPLLDRRVVLGHAQTSEYERLAADLRAPWTKGPGPRRTVRPLRVVAAILLVTAAAWVIAFSPAVFGLAGGLAVMLVLAWLLASPRTAYEGAIDLGIAPYVGVQKLRRAVVTSSCVLAAAFLLVSWSTLWHAVTVFPGSFTGVDPAAGRLSMLGFLGASLVRIQATLSVPDIFQVAESTVEQRPLLGSLMTLLIRTGLNLGFVAAVVAGISLRRDREGLTGLLRAPDSIAMRTEAIRGGRYSVELVQYHDRQVCNGLWAALDSAADADTQEALVTSGAFDWCLPYDSLGKPATPNRLLSQALVMHALKRQGWDVDSWRTELDTELLSGQWPPLIKAQALAHSAAALASNDLEGAALRLNVAHELLAANQGHGEALQQREARAVLARCALTAVATVERIEQNTDLAAELLTRSGSILATLAAEDSERFTIDSLRLATVQAPLLARTAGTETALVELDRAVSLARHLPPTHPWREAMLVQLLVATAIVNAIGNQGQPEQLADRAERLLLDEFGATGIVWHPDKLPGRSYDERLGAELGQAAMLLIDLPASPHRFAAAARAATVFEARARVGVAEALVYAEAMRFLAVATAHHLAMHSDVLLAAETLFRLGTRPSGQPRDDVLASTHAYCALAHRALGNGAAAYEHAGIARAQFAAIALAHWPGAQQAAATGNDLLVPFSAAPPVADDGHTSEN